MSLDIVISSRPKVDSLTLTTFTNNSPLIVWMERIASIGDGDGMEVIVDNEIELSISRENLQKLNDTLEQLNEANYQELFPVEDDLVYVVEDYSEDYWLHVAELKKWVKDTLNTFDFEKNNLIFETWY